MATVSASATSKGVTSKIQEVQKLTVTFPLQNDDIVITHADDPLWGRQISVYTSAGLQLDIDDVSIEATSATTSTVTNLTAGALTGAVVVCVVPVT